MKAKVGDRIICHSNTVGAREREGEVKDTGPEGQPPFQVQWTDGSESLFRPGPDAIVKPTRKKR